MKILFCKIKRCIFEKSLSFVLSVQIVAAFLHSASIQAQIPPRQAKMATTQAGLAVSFKSIDPPLNQIPGGRPAFYSYFWEFGDGDYSTEAAPKHQYGSSRLYNPILALTAHYDDGDSPLFARQTLQTAGGVAGTTAFATPFESNEAASIKIISNRNARPNEDMILVLGYQNLLATSTSGFLHLFFNEKAYPTPHFKFSDSRQYHGETRIGEGNTYNSLQDVDFLGNYAMGGQSAWIYAPPTKVATPPDYHKWIDGNLDKYQNQEKWRFSNLRAGEKRNLFITMTALPEMLKDTSATIYITGLFLPDDPAQAPMEYIFEMEIVAAHDPNAIAVSDVRTSFRKFGQKKLNYKVRFQNDGEGPANNIKVLIEQPKGLYRAKLSPQCWYPPCPPCDQVPVGSPCLTTIQRQDSLYFVFNNIYLPGSKQEDVQDKDSTRGFVVYRIEPSKKMPKQTIKTRAHIIFKGQDPVITNYTNTRFKPGFSPGPKVGYHFSSNAVDAGYYFAGCSFAPFSSWKVYPQVEILTGYGAPVEFGDKRMVDSLVILNSGQLDSLIISTTLKNGTNSFFAFDVPFMVRRSLNSWVAIGGGINSQIVFSTESGQNSINKTVYLRDGVNGDWFQDMGTIAPITEPYKTTTRDFNFSAIADLTLGRVRKGPNLGFRFGFPLGARDAKPWIQTSIEWKI